MYKHPWEKKPCRPRLDLLKTLAGQAILLALFAGKHLAEKIAGAFGSRSDGTVEAFRKVHPGIDRDER